MKNSIALFVVLYPGIDTFVSEFKSSLENQTRKDFDLIILNDGYSQTNIQFLFSDFNIVELNYSSTISKNREYGINYVINHKYDFLILCDVDDYYSKDRVAKTVEELEEADIVVNNLNIVSCDKKVLIDNYLSYSISDTTKIDLAFLLEKNILGFSNTGLRVDRLNEICFPEDLKIVDWYYFTLLLYKRLTVKYIPCSLTFYRQHSDNLIGIGTFTVDQFKKLSQLKLEHYSFLSQLDLLFSSLRDRYARLLQLSESQIKLKLEVNRENNKYPLWWELINL